MDQATTIDNELMINRHRKGSDALTNELVKLSLNQYKKDNDKIKLKMDLQKIALMCSSSALKH
ncbi:MAG: hypothetical protein HQL70_04515 [Magnetococcales bacterium]|nr:hypothetical protein [Magnetococcales bacterium]